MAGRGRIASIMRAGKRLKGGKYDEALHPRGPGGKFKAKPGGMTKGQRRQRERRSIERGTKQFYKTEGDRMMRKLYALNNGKKKFGANEAIARAGTAKLVRTARRTKTEGDWDRAHPMVKKAHAQALSRVRGNLRLVNKGMTDDQMGRSGILKAATEHSLKKGFAAPKAKWEQREAVSSYLSSKGMSRAKVGAELVRLGFDKKNKGLFRNSKNFGRSMDPYSHASAKAKAMLKLKRR